MNESQIARMREAFTALDVDTEATYRFAVTEGAPATGTRQTAMPGATVHNLIRAQTRLAAEITQDDTGKITVLLAHKSDTRRKTCTYEKVTLREFIIVGQCQGTGYTLWDIAPAPTDPARRAAVLEEIGVDAADALGSMNTEHGATAREALANFLADMRRQSGLDDYDLTADSRTERIDEVDAVRAHSASADGVTNITATVKPGADSLTIAGAHPYESGWVQQRIRAGLINGGYDVPAGEVAVSIDNHRNLAQTHDLATACAILAAAAQLDRYALDRVVCLGELEWDGDLGGLESVIEDGARTAHANGYRTVLVPAGQAARVRRLGLDLDVIGVSHIREAVEALNGLAVEHPTATSEQIRANKDGLGLLAWVLRQTFPAATAIAVHVGDRELVAVLDDDGAPLWDLRGEVLPAETRLPVTTYLTALLADRDESTLAALGWIQGEVDGVFRTTFPAS
ncbi:magnesium chelatase domain-containing protein [Streptomyces collinus]|uniref:magnesium chelatase domain-containing protein n=1 Tax=Streptomyces collinus TaxID=42684 RepID=UPI0036B1865C